MTLLQKNFHPRPAAVVTALSFFFARAGRTLRSVRTATVVYGRTDAHNALVTVVTAVVAAVATVATVAVVT